MSKRPASFGTARMDQTQPTSDAHLTIYPISLIEPCILAGCPERGSARSIRRLSTLIDSGTYVASSSVKAPTTSSNGKTLQAAVAHRKDLLDRQPGIPRKSRRELL